MQSMPHGHDNAFTCDTIIQKISEAMHRALESKAVDGARCTVTRNGSDDMVTELANSFEAGHNACEKTELLQKLAELRLMQDKVSFSIERFMDELTEVTDGKTAARVAHIFESLPEQEARARQAMQTLQAHSSRAKNLVIRVRALQARAQEKEDALAVEAERQLQAEKLLEAVVEVQENDAHATRHERTDFSDRRHKTVRPLEPLYTASPSQGTALDLRDTEMSNATEDCERTEHRKIEAATGSNVVPKKKKKKRKEAIIGDSGVLPPQ